MLPDEIEVYSEKLENPRTCIRIKVEERDTFIEETNHFLSCVKKGENPVTSGEEERRPLAVICAGYESLNRGGAPVKVRY